MKTLKTLSILFAFALLISSCSKSEDGSTQPTYLLSKISYKKSSETTVLLYNSNNKLISVESDLKGAFHYLTTIVYNSNGQIYETLQTPAPGGSGLEKTTYIYNADNKIIEKKYFTTAIDAPNDFKYTSSDFYEYNGNTIESKRKIKTDNFFSRRSIYNLDSNKNVTNATFYKNMTEANPQGIISYSTNFEYDTKSNYLKSLPSEYMILTSYTFPIINNNNYTKATTPQNSTTVSNLVYEYNSDGYPIKRTTDESENSITMFEYKKI